MSEDDPKRKLSLKEWLWFHWITRERKYGWLWLGALIGLAVAFYFVTRNPQK